MNISPENLIQLALGLALFAFGWTLFRYGIRAVGFGLGFMAGYSTYNLLLEWIPKINEDFIRYFPQNKYIAVIVGVVLGIVGMYLAKKMYMVVVFLGSFLGAMYLLYTDDHQRNMIIQGMVMLRIWDPINNTLGELWPALLSLLVAGFFVFMQKQMMILITACVGSYIIVETIHIPVLFLPLCFAGFLLQQTQSRWKRKRVKREAEE